MARPPMSVERRRAAAIQAAQRAVSRGERPLYRVAIAQDGSWHVAGAEWLSGSSEGRREALADARAAVADLLEVPADTFDMEA